MQNRHAGFLRYFEIWRALLRIRSSENPDAYILSFRGYGIFWFVRQVTRRKSLVFDALMSLYAALREEHKAGFRHAGRTVRLPRGTLCVDKGKCGVD